jgi:hypothetical protein
MVSILKDDFLSSRISTAFFFSSKAVVITIVSQLLDASEDVSQRAAATDFHVAFAMEAKFQLGKKT